MITLDRIKLSEELDIEDYDSMHELCKAINEKASHEYRVDEMSRNREYDIDWDDVLDMCRKFVKLHGGFNVLPEKLNDYSDFLYLRDLVLGAMDNTQPMIRRKCIDCQKAFFLYLNEIKFYNSKQLPLPKRCTGCRKKRRRMLNYSPVVGIDATEK